jgi:hypothetical protein
MRKTLLLALPALLLAAPASSSAQIALPACERPATLTAPFAFVTVNGQCTNLSALITRASESAVWTLTTHLTLAGSEIDLHAIFDPDPSITFGGTTVNTLDATVTYAFLFGTPVIPDFYTSATSSLGLSVTTPMGTTTVAHSAVYPTYVSGYGTVGLTATNLGVDLGTTPCVATGTGVTTTCNPGMASNSFAPTFYDNLEALITYTQDRAASSVAFTGAVTLDQAATVVTPEPATFLLVGIGLLAIGATTSRRRKFD